MSRVEDLAAFVYERLTGRPWYTGRSAAAEFGPPPGARYARELAAYSDAELIAQGPQIIAELAARRARHARQGATR